VSKIRHTTKHLHIQRSHATENADYSTLVQCSLVSKHRSFVEHATSFFRVEEKAAQKKIAAQNTEEL